MPSPRPMIRKPSYPRWMSLFWPPPPPPPPEEKRRCAAAAAVVGSSYPAAQTGPFVTGPNPKTNRFLTHSRKRAQPVYPVVSPLDKGFVLNKLLDKGECAKNTDSNPQPQPASPPLALLPVS